MANTIQKKIKFSKGQIVPELVERTDLDLFDASAQKMNNVISTVYGGVRSRRGTIKVDRLITNMEEKSGTVSIGNIGGNASDVEDKNNRFVSGAILNNRTVFTIDYGDSQPNGTLKLRGIKLDFEEPKVVANKGQREEF